MIVAHHLFEADHTILDTSQADRIDSVPIWERCPPSSPRLTSTLCEEVNPADPPFLNTNRIKLMNWGQCGQWKKWRGRYNKHPHGVREDSKKGLTFRFIWYENHWRSRPLTHSSIHVHMHSTWCTLSCLASVNHSSLGLTWRYGCFSK